jgi:hypothetical protein
MTTIPGEYSFKIYQGSTFRRRFTFKDSADSPINLTGMILRMQCRPQFDSTLKIFDLDNAGKGGITIIDAAGGVFEVEMSATITAAITQGGYYDIEMQAPNGDVSRLFQGVVTADPEATRS